MSSISVLRSVRESRFCRFIVEKVCTASTILFVARSSLSSSRIEGSYARTRPLINSFVDHRSGSWFTSVKRRWGISRASHSSRRARRVSTNLPTQGTSLLFRAVFMSCSVNVSDFKSPALASTPMTSCSSVFVDIRFTSSLPR